MIDACQKHRVNASGMSAAGGPHDFGQVERSGGAGGERVVAGERELRGEDRFLLGFLEPVREVSAKLK